MSLRPYWSLLSLSLRRTSELGGLLVGLVWIASQVESGDASLSLRALLSLLCPVAAAGGTALAVGELRARGDWSAWEGCGYSSGRQLKPLALLLLIGLVLQSQLPLGVSASSLQLPPPVPAAATAWPGFADLGSGELEGWQRRPGELGWFELLERRQSVAPEGSRRGVDLAELLRRTGWLLAWPVGLALASLFGLRVPVVAREGRGYGPLAAAVLAGLGTVCWCLVVLVASAAAAA